MTIKLEIQNIKKTFSKNNNNLTVLDGMNFYVNSGEILCILGPSGCGKSTLLRHIAGFESPDFGCIFLNGEQMKKPGPNRVMVFQDSNQLFPWMTVLENVLFPMGVNKIGNSKIERKQIAEKYLDMVELQGFYNYYPHQLSGGMKQKAAIARSLAINPEVLLMDEPFGSLDAQTKSGLHNLLLQIWKKTGVTIVLVTHDIQEAIILSNRIIVMNKSCGYIKRIIDNTLENPRVLSDSEFGKMYNQIYDLLKV